MTTRAPRRQRRAPRQGRRSTTVSLIILASVLACVFVVGAGLFVYWGSLAPEQRPEVAGLLVGNSPTPPGTATETASPAPSATPTISATPTNTPTNTATSTPTSTATNTTTATATMTLTQSLTPSQTPLPRRTFTRTPTTTLDPAFTPSPTASPSSTTTPTPTPGCHVTTDSPTIAGKIFSLSLTNNADGAITITRITFDWDPNNGLLTRITLSGNAIWTQGDSSPPTDITGGWQGSSQARTLTAGETQTLTFTFFRDVADTYQSVTVYFDNNCSISQTTS